jgi:acyl-CoA thioesterase
VLAVDDISDDVDVQPGDDGVVFPLRDMLGFTISQGEGTGVAELELDERHMNPHGAVHGGVMFVLVDTAMGAAAMSVVGEGNRCATLDIHTRYLSPCFGGRVTATATVRKPGRRVVHLDATVVGDDGREYTAATGVFAVIPVAG